MDLLLTNVAPVSITGKDPQDKTKGNTKVVFVRGDEVMFVGEDPSKK